MSIAPRSALRICSCKRATRPSRTEGGTSSRAQLISPRRTALGEGHGKQAPRSPGQDFAAVGCDAHGIAVYEIPDLRMIGIRMDYERHVRLELQIDVLEHRGPRVDIKPQAVPAHAGVLRCHVVAEAMVAKYFVLGTCDVPSRGPRAYRRDARFERLVVYSEGPLLRLARFSEHEGAADLRVITVHARGQLGRHQVAGREAPFRRRMHPAHFTSAGAPDLEILGAAAGAEKSLDFRAQRIFRPAPAA